MAATKNPRPINLPPPAAAQQHATRPSRLSAVTTTLAVVTLIASAIFAVSLVTAQEGTPGASTPGASPEATPSATMPRLELELEELNDSGIEGTVTLYDAGELTIVEFDVEGAGGDHPANISAGVCGDLEPEPAHELEPVDEEGESLTVVDVRLSELLETPHAIDMRLAPDQLGTLIACANIEGEPEVPEATPGATAEASPTGEGGQVTAAETPTATATQAPTVPAETPTAAPTTEATTVPTVVSSPDATATDGTGGAVDGKGTSPTIALRELNDSGVTGTAILTDQGTATRISLTLTGDGITGDHIAHLHSGTCDAPGEYTYTLNPVSAEGTSETVVNIALDELLAGGYMINVHPSEANWDTWMVCGELTAPTAGATAVTPTPSTGGQVTAQPTKAPSTTTTIPVQTIPPAPVGDGTAGGTTVTVTGDVSTLPQTAGVGAMLEWPSDPRTAVLWASTIAATILTAAAIIIRRGERQTTNTNSRWTRLGI